MDSNDFTSDNNKRRINKKLCPDIKKNALYDKLQTR